MTSNVYSLGVRPAYRPAYPVNTPSTSAWFVVREELSLREKITKSTRHNLIFFKIVDTN